MNFNLARPFFESARKYPNKLAITADGKDHTYRETLESVMRVANWLSSEGQLAPKRFGILASRSMEACVGILASAWVGATYVPVNLKLPEAGVIGLLQRSRLDAIIADRTGSQKLTPAVLDAAPARVLCHREYLPQLSSGRAFDFGELESILDFREPVMTPANFPAYILYTSGSTGVPKGVTVLAGGVDELLNVMDKDYGISEDDRTAETTDTSFDLTVYNMFVTWRAGASLHVIPHTQAMAPARFINEHRISVWLSVPSIAGFMGRMGMLNPNSFPSLKYTFFAGEPLLASVAEAWHQAAPNSRIANMYGPTEATVICIGQEYGHHAVLTRDTVAIGRPFANMKAAIAKDDLTFALTNEQGELLLAGPQLALGYLDDPEKTAARFVTLQGTRWYRTGDLAACDENGIFHYFGRIDNQVKILGYRVELEEIECHLRDVTKCADVAAVAWPQHGGTASGVAAFVVDYGGSEEDIKAHLQTRLPPYMVPSKIYVLGHLPLSANGKIDRSALVKILQTGSPGLKSISENK